MNQKWYVRPVFTFIAALIALGTSLYLYIHWYLEAQGKLVEFASQYSIPLDRINRSESWPVILTLSLLVAAVTILFGLIYLYTRKLAGLYRLQQNFINGFTHELKTPLASIQLYLETFEKHELTRDSQLKYISYMKNDTIRLHHLVERILSTSTLENKKSLGHLKSCLFSTWLDEDLIPKKKQDQGFIDMKKLPEEVFSLKLNRSLIGMVIDNLIINGLTHNISQTPTIEISGEIKGRYLHLRFKDNGIGIRRNEFKTIFKKFYQIGTKSKGNGLGLFLSMALAKFHKGRLVVDRSTLGSGTTILLILPIIGEVSHVN